MISTYSAPRLCGLSMDDVMRQVELLHHLAGVRYEHSLIDDAMHVIYDNQIILTITVTELEDFEPQSILTIYYQAKIEIEVMRINALYAIEARVIDHERQREPRLMSGLLIPRARLRRAGSLAAQSRAAMGDGHVAHPDHPADPRDRGRAEPRSS